VKERKERGERGAPPRPRRKWAACGGGEERMGRGRKEAPRKKGKAGLRGKNQVSLFSFFFSSFSKHFPNRVLKAIKF